jgi:PhzF family phenazine biosynthesis protein
VQKRPFKQVDVFTDQAYRGNPLAVVVDGNGLSTEDMQRFARWTNLSETTFLLPPTPEAAAQGADYRVRIFTASYEIPFAGHPTLGSCHAWREVGGVPKNPAVVVQECQVGLVNIRIGARRAAFAAPALRRSEPAPDALKVLLDALGLPASRLVAGQYLNNGPSFVGLLLDCQDSVLQLAPDATALLAALAHAGILGIGVAARQTEADPVGQTPGLEVRCFFGDGKGIVEDPVTGSFNAALAQWLVADGHAPAQYTAAQGTCLGVQGRVHIHQDASGQVWVGGDAVTCISGTVYL